MSESLEIEVNKENVSQVSDDVLFKKLKSMNLNPGPITPTTRRVYEKKLINLLDAGGITASKEVIVKNEISTASIDTIRSDHAVHQDLNQSFETYSRQISSIRSRAPLRADYDSTNSYEKSGHIKNRKSSSWTNALFAFMAFLIVLVLFYYYLFQM